MNKSLQIFFSILLSTQISFAQLFQDNSETKIGIEQDWARHYGADRVASSDQATSFVCDSEGNLYVTGTSGDDIVTIKYNSNGDTIWTRRYDGQGNGSDLVTGLAVDRFGNVYICGGSQGTNSFGWDGIAIKYSKEGEILWVRYYNGFLSDGYDCATGIVLDEALNVYVVGTLSSPQWALPCVIKYDQYGNLSWQTIIGKSGGGMTVNPFITLTNDGNIVIIESTITAKLNGTNGQIIWRKEDQILWATSAQCIATDKFGNIYVNTVRISTPLDYVTFKRDTNGKLIWTKWYGGPGDDWEATSAIKVDDIGNIYVTGTSTGQFLTVKLNSNGNIIWQKKYKGLGDGSAHSRSIDLDNFGNVIVTGIDENDFVTIKYDTNGNLLWERRFNGSGNGKDDAKAISVDANGFILVTGSSLGLDSDYDYTTIKYTPEGNTQWIKKYDGIPNSQDYTAALAIDLMGNAYLTGRSRSTANGDDYTTVKYNPNGDFLWENRFTGPSLREDRPTSIAVDSYQNVYVTGKSEESDTSISCSTIKYDSDGNLKWSQSYSSASSIWEGSSLVIVLAGNGQPVVTGSSGNANVLVKYDFDGNPFWSSQYNFHGNRYEAASIAIDLNDNTYVAGWTGTNGWWWSTRDFATVKYNSNGDTVWARVYDNGGGWDDAMSITVDKDLNVYVTGQSDGMGNSCDFTTIKYNANGDSLWIRTGYNGPVNGCDVATSIVTDSNGFIYVTGRSEGLNTGNDIVTIKYAPEGDTVWVRRYDSPEHSEDEPVALTIDTSGNIYIVGNSKAVTGDYDITTIKYSSNGELEWIMKYDAAQNLNWPNPTNDYAVAIKVSESGEVYIAGSSEMSWSTAGSSFYTLIKYVQQPIGVKQEYLQQLIDFQLFQNYPNPFNPTTTIGFGIPEKGNIKLSVLNILGEEIKVFLE